MKDYYDAYWGRATPPPVTDPLTRTRLEILWRLIERTRSGPCSLLDCGSGHGTLVAELRARDVYAVGMEISETALANARAAHPDAEFVGHSVEQRPWPIQQGSLDYVASFEVIEHLLQPQELLAGAYEALKPGGYLALTTPYHGVVKNLAIALIGFERHFDAQGDHIRFFTDRSLRRMVREAGFFIEETIHFGRLPTIWAGVFLWAHKR